METPPSPLPSSSDLGGNNSKESRHFQVPKSPSTLHQMPSKSRSNSLCKSLVVVLLLLVVIPLFPSQAPEFLTQRILTGTWEIIHLCLIGLAVSYGLFSRKRSGVVEAEMNAVVSSKNEDGFDFLSGLFFDDGFDELQSYAANCQCLLTSEGRFVGRDECVVHGSKNLRSLVSEKKVDQEWRLRYSKGESLVVVSNGVSDLKPLNLPIRSLKSVARDSDEEHEEKENCSKTDAKSNIVGNRTVKKRGVIPRNLDEKFEEEIAGDSWRSRSVRLQNEEEKMSSVSKQISRSRPRSVGEFEFEFENREPSSSRGSKISGSPEFGSSNSDNAEKRDDRRKRSFASNPKREVDSLPIRKNRSFGESEGEQSGNKSSNLDMKSPSLVKVLSKAKSVRTIKPRGIFVAGKENDKSDLEMKAEVHRRLDNQNARTTSHEFREGEKDSVSDQNLTESEEEFADEEDEKGSREMSNDRNVRENGNDDDDCTDLGSEVDRKAGEFIAKFREQIRLQKISSARKHSA